jgi:hypothetical protein
MLSTGSSIVEYIRENGSSDPDEITDFIEVNFENIVSSTIKDLKRMDSLYENNCDDDELRQEDEGKI